MPFLKPMIFGICLFNIFIFCACHQKNSHSSSARLNLKCRNERGRQGTSPHALAEEFYMRLEGEIGNQPVVMNLHRDKSECYGNYYYQGSWMTLSEMESGLKGTFIFAESGFDLNGQEHFIHLKWTGVGFSGKWTDENGRKSYPIILHERYPEGSCRFKQKIFKDSINGLSGKEILRKAEFKEQYIAAEGQNSNDKWLDKCLRLKAGLRADQSWDRGIPKKSGEILSMLLGELPDSLETDSAFIHSDYFDVAKSTILYNDKSFLVIEKSHSSYTGGLHPNYSTTMICYDLKTRKLLRLKDILMPGVNLSVVLETCFRKQYGLVKSQSLKEILFDDSIYENHNFFFNDKGIAFRYNPYEIAPYSEGEISVFVPFSMIKSMIRPLFLNRLRF
jgi:hypothetical protein